MVQFHDVGLKDKLLVYDSSSLLRKIFFAPNAQPAAAKRAKPGNGVGGGGGSG